MFLTSGISDTRQRKELNDIIRNLNDAYLLERDDTRQIKAMNRFHIQEVTQAYDGTQGFVFMTRPKLHLFELDGRTLRKEIETRCPFISYLWNYDGEVGKYIVRSLDSTCDGISTNFLPIITNKVRGYSPMDDTIETIERGKTWHGSKVIYGKENVESRSNVNISLPMVDDRNLTLFKTLAAWTEYIEAVDLYGVSPRMEDRVKGILDYGATLSYVLTRNDMKTILYWEHVIGIFPIVNPNSMLSYQAGNPTAFETTATFKASFKPRAMNIATLNNINTVSGVTKYAANRVAEDSVGGTLPKDIYVSTPYIKEMRGSTFAQSQGQIEGFELGWLK